MPVLLAHGVERPHLRTPWVLLAAVSGAVLDLGVAVLFWAAEGVDPLRIPQSIAAWFVGRAAYDGDTSTALFGVLAYTALVWLLAHLYLAAFKRHAALRRQPLRAGALFGASMYVAVFHVAVPLLAVEGGAPSRPDGVLVCLLACAGLIGVPIAWACGRVLRR